MRKIFINRLIKTVVCITLIFCMVVSFLLICCRLFPAKYFELVKEHCAEYSVDPYLVMALIKAESNFDANAVSVAGAKGLMQLADNTFLHYTKELDLPYNASDVFDVEKNIDSGVWYLSKLLKKYDNNQKNAVAAYNAGPSNVDKWLLDKKYSHDKKNLDSIPFGETQRHAQKIAAYRIIYKFLYS